MRAAASPSITRSLESAATNSRSVVVKYLAVVGIAAAVDLATKWSAGNALADGHVVGLLPRLSFMLVYNTGSAGGVTIGPYTWGLNVLVTIAALLMVMRIVSPLSAVDPRATLALGLVSGGAFGNLASMLAGPDGVTDFIALQLGGGTTIVMNVADLLLWSGALMLVPVVKNLVQIVRSQRATR